MSEQRAQSPIDCPKCGEPLEASVSSSVLASLRCASCGHMLAFDEVSALRDAERARTRKHD